MRSFALLLLLPFCSCVDVRYFAPRENENGTSPSGRPAAVYPFADAEREVAGELRIWSDGAVGDYSETDPEAYRVEVHVGFELENTGATAVELAGVRSENDSLSLVRLEGETRAAPGQTARVDTWFLAPAAGNARQVQGFAIRHSIVAGEHTIATQVTPFAPWRRNAGYRGPYYYYSPWSYGRGWYYGGSGFGWGAFWGGPGWCW
ncbi:MAG: hypothetical protein KDE27_22950 [Planctomycetes bacterium]|nr:hypothetical protein [Planctomycetota bacterium]